MTENALRLKDYIDGIHDFDFVEPNSCPYANHIGALFTDTILQAGLNYRHVVWPRVKHILENFPYANSVSTFAEVLELYGTANILRWSSPEKVRRMNDLISFCLIYKIETTRQLVNFLRYEENVDSLKSIHGIGDKTCDYMKRLLGFDTIAVDRHVRSFIKRANVKYDKYIDVKEVVEYAADFMGRSRRGLDYSIWLYMSKKKKTAVELSIDF